jgi:hypothetical protein
VTRGIAACLDRHGGQLHGDGATGAGGVRVSPANLLNLAPDTQEEILFLRHGGCAFLSCGSGSWVQYSSGGNSAHGG